jgi:hypothetical protein
VPMHKSLTSSFAFGPRRYPQVYRGDFSGPWYAVRTHAGVTSRFVGSGTRRSYDGREPPARSSIVRPSRYEPDETAAWGLVRFVSLCTLLSTSAALIRTCICTIGTLPWGAPPQECYGAGSTMETLERRDRPAYAISGLLPRETGSTI